ncbi:MAG: helix-turn-helix transcriptional regulator [Clostridia bacterium]|nr:helix-turn-helix transcriptional regulator [Clostridia bacterium]
MKLNENIYFFRKQKGMTQGELAAKLGVSDQAVSKWESAQCCPDLSLLPQLAEIFGVSLDTLFGIEREDTPAADLQELCDEIRRLFHRLEKGKAFDTAYRLSQLLHEAACCDGYKKHLPWQPDRDYFADQTPNGWSFSACSEPGGTTVQTPCGVFFSSSRTCLKPKLHELRALAAMLSRMSDPIYLRVMYALYSLTAEDFDRFVSAEEIAAEAKLTAGEVDRMLDLLPVTAKEEEGILLFRPEGSFMHLPPLLMMLRDR